ncbi:MAG TPA: magnesium-transporting ATPase, partial [Ruminococcaceae bacterium]|nr:magnesium-transporting ATPase [Oscillospiraceae bacterium]
PALTLGLEPIRGDLMKERPVSRKANMISPTMFAGILGNGLFLSFVFLLQQWTNFIGGTSAQQSTILFTLFVIFQLFNAFNCRELGQESILRHFTDNRLMLGVFALVFVLQVIITEFGGMVFGTVPLPLTIWVKIIITAVSVLVFSEIVKLLKRVFSKNAQLTTD